MTYNMLIICIIFKCPEAIKTTTTTTIIIAICDHANAIDVSGFVLADGRRITLTGDWNGGRREKQFLTAIHQSACKRFGTVLSPDYNAAHRDHFHFDMSGNGYCR